MALGSIKDWYKKAIMFIIWIEFFKSSGDIFIGLYFHVKCSEKIFEANSLTLWPNGDTDLGQHCLR